MLIGENCSQYKPERQGLQPMGIYEDEGILQYLQALVGFGMYDRCSDNVAVSGDTAGRMSIILTIPNKTFQQTYTGVICRSPRPDYFRKSAMTG